MEQSDTKQRIRGAEALVRCLLEEGVDIVFGYPGGAIMPVYDALYDHKDSIHHVLVRHEQGAIHAAESYAKVLRRPGVVIATSGPGATNLMTGLANAQIDSTPVVCITGQVTSSLLGFDAFQETDVVGVSAPITKWNFQVTSASEIATAIAKAFYIASTGRPGPVLIDITKDAQFQEVDFEYKKCTKVEAYYPYPKINAEQVKAAAVLINEAKKPLLLVGQGVTISRAEDELLQFVEKAGIPVACTLWGISTIPTKHPLYVGMLGMHGNYGPNVKTNECDLIIALGMRFDDRVTGDTKRYAKQAKIVHIEIDPSEVNKTVKSDVAVIGDAKRILQQLIPLVNVNKHDAWLKEFHDCYQIEFDKIIQLKIHPTTEALTMDEVVHLVSEKTKGEAIVVTDVGQNQMSVARYYKFATNNSFITSGGLGTMGFGLPAANGAKMAAPDRDVVTFVGDGGIQMTIQELGTIFQTQIPVKIVLLNNHYLGMVRQWQELFFDKRYSYTEMINPDFIAIAKAYSINARKVVDRAELEGAVEEMLASEQAYLLEVVVGKEDNVFPMVQAGDSVTNIRLE